MEKYIKILLGLLLLSMLWLPMLQSRFAFYPEQPLNGAVQTTAYPTFNWPDWWAGSFQEKYTQATKDQLGFRPDFIRARNQMAYSLFSTPRARNVVRGQADYLYEMPYINAYYGTDFLGTARLSQRLSRYKELQDSLANRGKHLLVCIAPSKASFFPEYIPQTLQKAATDSTNYYAYTQLLPAKGLNHIDFDLWFRQMKDTSSCPLFPRNGTHWSEYGMLLAADSILHYLEGLFHQPLPDLSFPKIYRTDEPRGVDNDIADGLNLLYPPATEELCYLHTNWVEDSSKYRPNLLVIGDSFYMSMSRKQVRKRGFSISDFWYYSNRIYSHPERGKKQVEHATVGADIQAYDVIILMGTAASLREFDWGFTGDALRGWPQ